MRTSVRWMNDYLDPPAAAAEMADLGMRAGFPVETSETVDVGGATDVRHDFELTSNRGDCACHVGLAREIAAMSGRALKLPAAPRPAPGPSAPKASSLIKVTNAEPARCPLYTARVIRGVAVGPSPKWLAERLVARGDIPRNNVVDATNFVLFELGQPTHVFDLAKLAGPEIVVRMARKDEPFLPIGEGETAVKLTADDLVIADARQAVALAGVKGGASSAVTKATTDLVLEAAAFDPVSVRTTSRRHGIASDSSYRFERGVHPGQVDAAADRLAALILELAGGTLADGALRAGPPVPGPKRVSMRPDRCRAILGVDVPDRDMVAALERLGFAPRVEPGAIACTVPVFRMDVEREIDLIEEVGRIHGLDRIPVRERIELRVSPPQASEMARQTIANELAAMGFVETVTHSLIGEEAAGLFLAPGAGLVRVDDERARSEPVLRPSIVPSLLRVRRHNQDNGVRGLRLFESAATFWHEGEGHREVVTLGLLMDVEDDAHGLRPLRGVVDRVVAALLGHDAKVDVRSDEGAAWLAPGGQVLVGGRAIGRYGLLAPSVAARFGLDDPLLAGEIELAPLIARFPPETQARPLPAFPAIERDLSILVAESARWADVQAMTAALALDHLEATEFVTTFRGKQIPAGHKSLTFRMRFRAADRTLRHDEVDPLVARVVAAAAQRLAAQVRT